MVTKTPLKRLNILTLGIVCFMGIIVLRLLYLQVIKHEFYNEKSQNQINKVYTIFPNRGQIFDRHQVPLAFSRPVFSAYAIPTQIKSKPAFARQVAAITGQSEARVFSLINNQLAFIWIKRKVSPEMAKALQALELEGLNFVQEDLRIYPQHDLLAHVLGFVGIDNQGLGGIEYQFDRQLQGAPGRIVLEGDPLGYRLVTGKRQTRRQLDGGNITITIDSYLQYVAQKALEAGIAENGAVGGQVVMMDPQTGDVLALVDSPAFDSNHWRESTDAIRKNSVVTDVYEPGSVFKLVTVAAAINEGLVTSRSVMTVPETLSIGGRTIREAHGRATGETDTRSVSEIIEKSLNVGTSLLAMKIGHQRFYRYITQFGFGAPTQIEVPAESRGILNHVSKWSKPDIAMISFGQGVAVTPIQMASAVSVIANNGVRVKPRLVWKIAQPHSLAMQAVPIKAQGRVISEKTAKEVKAMMADTVRQGTATAAQIPGYTIGGKTGTAQKVRVGGIGYEPGKYIASFIGFFPVQKPRVVILVIVDSPTKSIYGGTVAIPIFRQIALATIDHLSIPSDQWAPGQRAQWVE